MRLRLGDEAQADVVAAFARLLPLHRGVGARVLRIGRVELDLDLAVDLAPAGASDRLEDTVDYGAIAERAVRVVTESAPRDLLETLAETVAGTVLAADRRIEAVTVTLKKLRPPLAVDVSTVGVTISRVR